MKNFVSVLILLLITSLGWSAMSDYTFQQSPGTWQALANPTTIHSTGIDDAMSPVISIGFNFVLDDAVYSTFKANSNGFITLNEGSSASISNNLTAQTLILAGLWDDLKTNDTESHVAYELTGTAPNRVFTVEYKNLKWYYNASPVNLVNFQIKLYETTNYIEMIYGTMGTAPGTSASASIGVSGA
ncbi:MAG: hypothetical protein PHI68_04210, partial [Candidatus Cloacimonetes bacterium]|nr:hypothetical protein [Candidatus Cloacimonadota bacterium]